MFRKTIAVAIAALLCLTLLPSMAFAAPSGSAALAEGADVFPGADRPFAIDVDNDGMAVVGESINWVSVILPGTQGIATTDGVAAPDGWEVSTTDTSRVQNYTFTTDGSGVGPGNSMQFAFPADVAAPASDETADFRVFVSSDGGETTSRADGALTSVIRTLELESFGVTAPAGAADGTATSGQDVTFTAQVRNHASGAQDVTAATDGGSATQAVPSGSSQAIDIPVTLADVAQDTTQRFDADVTAPGSTAEGLFTDITIQVAPRLSLIPQTFSPNQVRSNAPIQYTFSVDATKQNSPGLTVDSCTLYFDADGTPNSFPLQGPVNWSANNQQTLTFEPGTVDGPTGTFAAKVDCSGTDANGAAYEQVPVDNDLSLDIDNLGPVITDVIIGLPGDQTAAKNGDEVTVEWDMDDSDATFTTTEVRDNRGNVMQITDISSAGSHYTGSATIESPLDDGTIVAQIEAIDFEGGNPGGASSDTALLDNLAPFVFDPARTTSNNGNLDSTIEVYLGDNLTAVSGGCDASHWDVQDNLVAGVRGRDDEACGDSQYRVLVLTRNLDIDETPAVTYNAGRGFDPIHDGAALQAVTTTIDTVVGILPPAPQLVEVTRNGGEETAVFDEDAYWTRFGGDDLQAGFTGGSAGWQAYVVDGSGNDVAGPFALAGGDEDTPDLAAIPIGSDEGRYARGIQLANAAGRGPITYFDVALDQTVPSIAQATAAGDEVTATFDDVVWTGDDFASSWYGYEHTADGLAAYQPASVDISDGDLTSRVLTFEFDTPENAADLADYLLASDNRYADRAGNTLADTLS